MPTPQEKLAAIKSPLPPEGLTVLKPKLDTLLQESVDANYQGERVIQLLRLQRADNFLRGIQNIAPTLDESTGSLFWTQFGSARHAGC